VALEERLFAIQRIESCVCRLTGGVSAFSKRTLCTPMSKEKCGATCSDGSECQAWAMDNSNRCRHHGGKSTGPKTEEGKEAAKLNAVSHSLYTLPEHLKKTFSEQQEDRYVAYFEALCSRYNRLHGEEPDAFAKDRLSRVAIECVKERIADEWLSEQAEETGNLLISSYIIGQDENDNPIEVEQENRILSELTALKRETRLTLKDMGLLKDPDSEKAEATRTLADVLSDE